MTDAEPIVTRNDSAGRYEIHVAGELAGFSDLIPGDGSIAFTHTETLKVFAGKGLGLRLAKDSVEDAVARDELIIPLCPFVRRYLETHEIPGARVQFPEPR